MKLLTLGGFKNVTVKHQLFELSVVWSYYFTFFAWLLIRLVDLSLCVYLCKYTVHTSDTVRKLSVDCVVNLFYLV